MSQFDGGLLHVSARFNDSSEAEMQLARVATYWNLLGTEVAIAADGFVDRAEAEAYAASLSEVVVENEELFLVGQNESRRRLDGADTMIQEPYDPAISRWQRRYLAIEGYCKSVPGGTTGKLHSAIYMD